jgi:hypothetical protein
MALPCLTSRAAGLTAAGSGQGQAIWSMCIRPTGGSGWRKIRDRSRSDDPAGIFDVGDEIGRVVGIEVRMDGGKDRVRIAVGNFDVAERDADFSRPQNDRCRAA